MSKATELKQSKLGQLNERLEKAIEDIKIRGNDLEDKQPE